ncbi:Rid family detoxifying hydrolase [Paenibacillus sp.]|uniref:Rid family detoxifying hydrolase n=1 Tax=Paenibacillus sp. TaxID=58172 RepID=UPI002D305810|nr:Rid family detoxifying hydrolase [Paenibacillus sp.]HZG87550.1 Rid family detoxifying hydrolase [Paenibacillus sp.]
MNPVVISTKEAPAAIGPYVQAMRVGNLVFTSGQIPLTAEGVMVEGGMAEQTRQVIRNLKAVAAACGVTLAQAVKATVYLKDMNRFAEFNAVYEEMFEGHKPARTTVEVARLPKDALVEIELVLALPEA